MRSLTLLALSLAVSAAPAFAAPIAANDLVIYRVGTGNGALNSSAAAVFLDEYTTSGSLVQSIAVTTSGANRLTASGSATSEGELTLSADGRYFALTGYDAAVGTASVVGTASSATKRVVELYGADGQLASTTQINAYSANNIRSAVATANGTLYTGGTGTTAGVRAVAADGSSTQLVSTPTNIRQVNTFGNQLFFGTGSGTTGIYAVGNGLPTTSGQTTSLIASVASPYSFFFADLNSNVAGVDTLYVADDSAGLLKFSTIDGKTWSKTGTISATGLTGLTGSVSNGAVQLFATSASKLYSFADSSGANGVLSGSLVTLASASTNTAFRGLAVTPVPEPGVFVLMLAGLGVLSLAVNRRA